MNSVQALGPILETFSEIQVGIVYASMATGRSTVHSDVDIAIYAGYPLQWEFRVAIAQTVEEQIMRSVDLVDMAIIHGPLLEQIFAHGILVLKRSSSAYASLLKRLWYDREDMAPLTRYVMVKQVERYFRGQ